MNKTIHLNLSALFKVRIYIYPKHLTLAIWNVLFNSRSYLADPLQQKKIHLQLPVSFLHLPILSLTSFLHPTHSLNCYFTALSIAHKVSVIYVKVSVHYKQGKCIEFNVWLGKSVFVRCNQLQKSRQKKYLLMCFPLKLVVYASNAKFNEASQKYVPANHLQHVGTFSTGN